MKKLFFLVAILLISTSVFANEKKTGDTKIWQIIIDNSALVLQEDINSNIDDYSNELNKFLFWMTEKRKDPNEKKHKLYLISVFDPRNIWVGHISQLKEAGKKIKDQIYPVENGCSDLVTAFRTAYRNLKKSKKHNGKFPENELIIFSPLIHTGSNCDGAQIHVPQDPPDDLTIENFENSKITFYWAHHEQVVPWEDYLEKTSVKYDVFDAAQSKDVISQLK